MRQKPERHQAAAERTIKDIRLYQPCDQVALFGAYVPNRNIGLAKLQIANIV